MGAPGPVHWSPVHRSGSSLARRSFLAAAGGAAGAALLAACGGGASSSSSGTSTSALAAAAVGSGEGQALSGDLLFAGLAASLEASAIATYTAGIADAEKGKFGSVPPALVTFAQAAIGQHREHQKAWNAMLTAAGKKPVTAADPVLAPKIESAYSEVTSVTELALLTYMVETVAGQTYQNALATIKGAAGIKTAAAIEPVEFQHAAILAFILGDDPVTAAFTSTTSARLVKDYRT